MNAAKTAFADYLNDANLDSRQIYFVNQIVEYIVQNGMMKDLSVLQEPPFTDQGSVVEVFTDLSVWLGIRAVKEAGAVYCRYRASLPDRRIEMSICKYQTNTQMNAK